VEGKRAAINAAFIAAGPRAANIFSFKIVVPLFGFLVPVFKIVVPV
jgi:hypothetical protein